MSQLKPRIVGHHKVLREAKGGVNQDLTGSMALDFAMLLASRIGREYNFVVWSQPVCSPLFRQPEGTHKDFGSEKHVIAITNTWKDGRGFGTG